MMDEVFYCDNCMSKEFIEVHQFNTDGFQREYTDEYRPKIKCGHCPAEFIINYDSRKWERVLKGHSD